MLAGFAITAGPPELVGQYTLAGEFNGKAKFANEATEAIMYFDRQWKLNSEDETTKWQYSAVAASVRSFRFCSALLALV